MEKHNKITPPMGSTQFIQGLPSRLHEINALITLALSKLEYLEGDAVDTAEGEAA